jgi:purine-binding chemotaxis protein CheW
MAIDMAQFHQMFFDECDEMLDRAWRLLGNGERFPQDENDIEGLYRCVHSIKGGGETFGFAPIGHIASALEAALDRVRDGQSKMDSDFGTVFREALDTLRMHVSAFRKGLSPGEDATNAVLSRLHSLQPSGKARAQGGPDCVFALRFRISHMIVGSELMMDFVLEELDRIGQVLATRSPCEDRAEDEWQVDVLTSAGEAALRAILDRVAEPGSLCIDRRESADVPARSADFPAVSDGAPDVPVAEPGTATDPGSETASRTRGVFLSFLLGTQRYAVDACKVRQLAVYCGATRIAGCPEFFRGVGEVDGTLVPVIDLRLCLGSGSGEITPFTTQILAECDRKSFSVLVDSVEDLITLSVGDIRPLPEMPASEGSAAHISGLVSHDDGMLMMLDLEGLIRSALKAPRHRFAHGLPDA